MFYWQLSIKGYKNTGINMWPLVICFLVGRDTFLSTSLCLLILCAIKPTINIILSTYLVINIVRKLANILKTQCRFFQRSFQSSPYFWTRTLSMATPHSCIIFRKVYCCTQLYILNTLNIVIISKKIYNPIMCKINFFISNAL